MNSLNNISNLTLSTKGDLLSMLRELALEDTGNKDLGTGLIVAATVFAVIKFGSPKPSGQRSVTPQQLEELRSEIAKVQQDVEDVKAHVFAVLDEETARVFAADVYGVGEAVRAWTETGDPTFAKGALSLVEALDYRFVGTLRNPPDFMTDETKVVLGKLFIRHNAFRLAIHAASGLQHWSDAHSESLVAALPEIGDTLLTAQTALRTADYSLCLGERSYVTTPSAGGGEPGEVIYSQPYGLSHKGSACEILGTAGWSVDTYAGDSTSAGLARAEAKEFAKVRKVVAEEIRARSKVKATADLEIELDYLSKLASAQG
ncbi:hypothetical protein EU803_06185 [Loktanella sp. IMCC34160]|uniref:hypothetical protein n=1 Tax=Loktanella sp. IMCC34160 TaxID=2510646 RepID=UPI00101DA9C5|nr:hypothetical protein [Loktanella sp. IMCC34160]RYG92034.1 hypothetical protein EU803_06185 [Loktanella sp. IMCC34160]